MTWLFREILKFAAMAPILFAGGCVHIGVHGLPEKEVKTEYLIAETTSDAGFPPPDLPPPGGGELRELVELGESASSALTQSGGGREGEEQSELEKEIRARLAGATDRLVEYRGKDGFFAMAVPIPRAVEQEMHLKKTWRDGCPVPISGLSYVVLGYRGFDAKPQIGELVVHRKLARLTIEAFGELYSLRFPFERMELIERYDGDDGRSMAANNTSAFNCRDVGGRPGVFSNHSYGSAIDINPVQNPYVVPQSAVLKELGWDGSGGKAAFLKKLGYPAVRTVETFCQKKTANCYVSPPRGRAYLDRTRRDPGALVEGPVIDAFTRRGFEWGGAWANTLDYQHLEVKPAKLR